MTKALIITAIGIYILTYLLTKLFLKFVPSKFKAITYEVIAFTIIAILALRLVGYYDPYLEIDDIIKYMLLPILILNALALLCQFKVKKRINAIFLYFLSMSPFLLFTLGCDAFTRPYTPPSDSFASDTSFYIDTPNIDSIEASDSIKEQDNSK